MSLNPPGEGLNGSPFSKLREVNRGYHCSSIYRSVLSVAVQVSTHNLA